LGLDLRTFQDLLSQLTRSAGRFAPEWSARERDDAGMVLAAVYAHYLEILLGRLNRVPAHPQRRGDRPQDRRGRRQR
jgi:hypothetical protein